MKTEIKPLEEKAIVSQFEYLLGWSNPGRCATILHRLQMYSKNCFCLNVNTSAFDAFPEFYHG
jgi:hypothetical protein